MLDVGLNAKLWGFIFDQKTLTCEILKNHHNLNNCIHFLYQFLQFFHPNLGAGGISGGIYQSPQDPTSPHRLHPYKLSNYQTFDDFFESGPKWWIFHSSIRESWVELAVVCQWEC